MAETDIDAAVAERSSLGIDFEAHGGDIATVDKGIFRGDTGNAPDIAWLRNRQDYSIGDRAK